MTLTSLPDPIVDRDVDLDGELICECRHEEGACGTPATARVTAVCQAEGCDCGAWTALACGPCLLSWKRLARRDGVRLRIHPLRSGRPISEP